VILGDEGEARLYTDGNVDEIRSTDPGVGGTDTITLGNGTNIVIAGAGNGQRDRRCGHGHDSWATKVRAS
jgi:hypothetical protein